MPAYWHEHGRAALFKSTDGIIWDLVSLINEGDRNDETDIEFLPDGRLSATARLEYTDSYVGDPRGATLITLAEPPFTVWKPQVITQLTRLDGPNLFKYNGRIYAVGRYQPVTNFPLSWAGSILATKRTSLFEVRTDRLVYLSDLPSAGDTAYEGVVQKDGSVYICYYTSDIQRDWPWIIGMISPSSIRMAQVDLSSLESLTKSIP